MSQNYFGRVTLIVIVLAAALFGRFQSRGNADFMNKVMSAQRFAFGGHLEKKD